ncbi:DUF2637 domain-containing protein [Microtetraspora malaysiensis]|uniref:DUF2637 domain-containing protein n=1 Tax=Microtetraspora malaysiensis TaxID=161358 RepID=UPI003D8E0F9D
MTMHSVPRKLANLFRRSKPTTPVSSQSSKGGKIIRGVTTAVVAILAAVAAVISYRHIYEVATAYGEEGWTAHLVPITIDGLIIAASLTFLDAAFSGRRPGWLSWVALTVGIALTLAANVLHGWAFGVIGAVTAALPAITLTISFELLMGLIRKAARSTVETVTEDVAEVVETEAPAEIPATAPETPAKRPGAVRPGVATVAAVKAFLIAASAPEDVKPEDLADVIPGKSKRTARAALAKARKEIAAETPKPAETGEPLPMFA